MIKANKITIGAAMAKPILNNGIMRKKINPIAIRNLKPVKKSDENSEL